MAQTKIQTKISEQQLSAAERRLKEQQLSAAERRLKKIADIDRRNGERKTASTAAMYEEMRATSRIGLSYDRIAQATGLSKTQIARVLRG